MPLSVKSASPARAERSASPSSLQPPAAAPDPREQDERPRVVHRADLVPEKTLRIRELPLRLGEPSLLRVASPQAAAVFAPSQLRPPKSARIVLAVSACLRAVSVWPRANAASASIARQGMAGRALLDARLLDGTERARPCLVHRPGEVEGPCEAPEGRDEQLAAGRLRKLDRAPAVDHRLTDVAFDHAGPHHGRGGLDVGPDRLGSACGAAAGEIEQAPALQCRAAEYRCHGGTRDGELGVLEQLLVRKRAHPPEEGSRTAVSDQRQVICGQDVGHRGLVPRRGRMLERLGEQAPPAKPVRRPPVDLLRGARLKRRELEPGELGKEGVDPEPGPSLEAGDGERGALQLG